MAKGIKSETKTGPELMDVAASEPTLDKLLDRHPSTLKTPEEKREYIEHIVKVSRAERAMFNVKQEKKRNKKKGIQDDDDDK